MKVLTLLAISAILLAACAWESGRAVIITPVSAHVSTRDTHDEIAIDVFRRVAERLHMEVRGPISGPGADRSFEAHAFPGSPSPPYFLVLVLGDHPEFVVRTLLPGASPHFADPAIDAFEAALMARGFKYAIHHT